MANIITLTTDWHNNDYYVGAIKASVLSRTPSSVFVDISHNIDLFSIQQAAFVIKAAYKRFPQGTIHIVGVDSEPVVDGGIVVAEYEGQYFIANNNGILGLVFDKSPERVVVIKIDSEFEGATFPELNIFAEIACYISKKGDILNLGEQVPDVLRFPELLPIIDSDTISGSVIYVDSYFNAITNISRQLFEEYVNNSKFEILFNSNYYKSNKVYNSYKEVKSGDIVCVFNSLDLLEIAIREGKASLLLNLDKKSIIKVKYNL